MNALITGQSIEDAPFILELEGRLRDLAIQNSQEALSGAYTGPEALAIVVFEMLKSTSDIELAGIQLRGKLIKEIETRKLHEFLPDRYESAEQAIDAVAHISKTQQSIIKGLTEVVFPYIESQGMSVSDFWSRVGRSNAAEIVPHMKAIITGKNSKSKEVNAAVKMIMDRVGGDNPEETKKAAVNELIDMAGLTTTELRKQLDPDPTPNIPLLVITRNNRTFILAEVDQDQLSMLMKAAGRKFDTVYTDENPIRIPLVKKLLGG